MIQAALFDLDGVVLDTERQYNKIWGRIGRTFHPDADDFCMRIKGMTLNKIFDEWFAGDAVLQRQVCQLLDDFEAKEMRYDFCPGVENFISSLTSNGIKTALVTSSNSKKMSSVRRVHCNFDSMFDCIVTADMVSCSKPDPECFLLGAKMLKVPVENCVVFEDSLNGLAAGRAAGMFVVGVAGTYPHSQLVPLAHTVIDSFVNLTPKSILYC